VRLYLKLRAGGCDPGPRLSAAWEQFYRAEAPGLLRLARGYARVGTDPQDGAQAIWQAIIIRLPALRFDPDQGSLRAWLMTVARHALIDLERRERTHQTARLEVRDTLCISSPCPEPALVCEVHQLQELVRVALADLRTRVSEPSYQILHQHWIEGKSFGEIGNALGLTSKQVRDRHDRMLRKLRPLLIRQTEGRSPRQNA
jgi:RNA polymerase sigma factor (sigma-70 family)